MSTRRSTRRVRSRATDSDTGATEDSTVETDTEQTASQLEAVTEAVQAARGALAPQGDASAARAQPSPAAKSAEQQEEGQKHINKGELAALQRLMTGIGCESDDTQSQAAGPAATGPPRHVELQQPGAAQQHSTDAATALQQEIEQAPAYVRYFDGLSDEEEAERCMHEYRREIEQGVRMTRDQWYDTLITDDEE